MNRYPFVMAAAALLAVTLFGTTASAQVVRESDVNSLAGMLDDYWNPADSFTFSSRGGEILFADVDAEIFQVRGRRGGDHDDDGDCGGHSDDDAAGAAADDDGHDDHGGPGGLCLQVFDTGGTMLCWADRPARPGWQRDPSIACPLPDGKGNSQYVLRVSIKSGGCGPGGHGHDASSVASEGIGIPYVLNWSLRRVASDGGLLNQSNRSGNP